MFTTFMIAPQGLVTGQWQSLGYWLAQHEVARGSQPYYYYLLRSYKISQNLKKI